MTPTIRQDSVVVVDSLFQSLKRYFIEKKNKNKQNKTKPKKNINIYYFDKTFRII